MRKTRGSTAGCVLGALGGLALPVALQACVTPKDDYSDFLDRTADARAALSAPTSVDASGFEAALPDGGFQGTYYISCLSPMAGGDVTQALSFQGALGVVPNGGGGSTATLRTSALVVGATDLSQTVGAANVATGTIDSTGVGAVVYAAPIVIPAQANPITGNEIDIAPGAAYHLYVTSAAQLCAGLSAQVTMPIVLTLTADSNPCVFVPFPQPSGALPQLTASDFHCP